MPRSGRASQARQRDRANLFDCLTAFARKGENSGSEHENHARPVFLLVGLLPGLARAVDVANCGTTVQELDSGRLVADLDCTGSSGIQLNDDATLDMNGHAIIGGTWAVYCFGDCTVVGPGDISGATAYALWGYRGRAAITNVHFDANPLHIDLPLHKVVLTDVTATNGGHLGGSFAIRTGKLFAHNVVVTGNLGAGIITSGSIRGNDVTVSSNGDVGISSLRSIKILRLTSTDNLGVGLYAGAGLRLTDSLLTGNMPLPAGADIISRRRPRLRGTTCGTSLSVAGSQLGPTWGTCTND